MSLREYAENTRIPTAQKVLAQPGLGPEPPKPHDPPPKQHTPRNTLNLKPTPALTLYLDSSGSLKSLQKSNLGAYRVGGLGFRA